MPAPNSYPPGPKLSRLDGFLLAARRRDLPTFLTNLAREYGDIVHFQIGPRHVFVLNHPDYIANAMNSYYKNFLKARPIGERRFLGEGLLTSEGDFHRRRRRLVKPAFHGPQIAAHAAMIVRHGLRLRESWRDGQEIEMMREMKSLTLSIAGKMLFDIEFGKEVSEINEAMNLVLSQFSPFGSPLSKLFAKLPMSQVRRRYKAQSRLDAIIRRIVAERRRGGEDRGDLLSMLIRAQREDAQHEEEPGTRMTDENVRDEALILLMAGHETMALALTWTWYSLAQHPNAEAELHAEIDKVLAGRSPCLADVAELHYTKMVLTESMRLYPPSWCLARYVARDYAVDGYKIPAGSILIMSPYVMHRDPRYFPDASRFDPQRWTPEARSARPQYSYFPFGGGPRSCVGEGLAWTQGILLVATLAQRWRMRLVPGRAVTPNPVITLRPKHGMPMIVEKRETATGVMEPTHV